MMSARGLSHRPPAPAAFIWLRHYILTRSTPSKRRLAPPKEKPRLATSPISRMAVRTFISLIQKRFEDRQNDSGPRVKREAQNPEAARSSRRDYLRAAQ